MMGAGAPGAARTGKASPAPVARRPGGPALRGWPTDWLRAHRYYDWLRAHLTDEWAIALIAIALSIAFFRWYWTHGLTIAFNDSRSREVIARRVLMSRTPGLAQLGATWLPLPSILMMLPLIWSSTLFSDGVAGSLPTMAGYVVAAVYMYRIVRLVTSSRWPGWVAAAALMLNPSVLYMQSTPMSEMLSVSALVVTVYYALRVTYAYHALDIAKCAVAVALGTLVRYENWVIGITVLPIFVYAAWRRQGYRLAEAWTILYSLLAFAGCAAWVLYNLVIFHDPLLSFFYGQSSHKYFAGTPARLLPARHHAMFALTIYGLTVVDIAGWAMVALALAGFAIFLWRTGFRAKILPVYLTLVPFAFYWFVLYAGINTESLPQLGTGPFYNIRFGMLAVPAIALFAGFVAVAGQRIVRCALASAALVVIAVSFVTGSMTHTPFVLREALNGYGGDTKLTDQAQARWLSAHYRGGNILCTYVSDPGLIYFLLAQQHFSDHVFITDANGAQFAEALARPQRWATWIVMNPSSSTGSDPLWTKLHRDTGWRRYFVLQKRFAAHRSILKTYGTVEIFERRTATANRAGRNQGAPRLPAVWGAPRMPAVWGRRRLPAVPGGPRMPAVWGARRLPAVSAASASSPGN